MAAKRRATIQQVAEEAGISAQTVSRVINNRPDVPKAVFFCPPLTTIRQDLHELGRCAVRELGRLIDGDGQEGRTKVQPAAVLLQPELIVRETTTKKVTR
jgi:DNA-binding LacI/PurR family transcriptional regulator